MTAKVEQATPGPDREAQTGGDVNTAVRECLTDGSDCGSPACPEGHDSETCQDALCSHPNCKTDLYTIARIEKLKSERADLLEALQALLDIVPYPKTSKDAEFFAQARAAIAQAGAR